MPTAASFNNVSPQVASVDGDWLTGYAALRRAAATLGPGLLFNTSRGGWNVPRLPVAGTLKTTVYIPSQG